MSCKCGQDFIMSSWGFGLYNCPNCTTGLISLKTISFLYCASCQTIFDKGCVHSDVPLKHNSYCAKIITSYKFIGVAKKFYGMPKFAQVENFEKLTDIVWECTCNFRDRCVYDKKGWIANCRNFRTNCFYYISSIARNLQICTNGECYPYLFFEFLEDFGCLKSHEVFDIINMYFNIPIIPQVKEIIKQPIKKKLSRKEFFSMLSKNE